jgi:inner membrane protein
MASVGHIALGMAAARAYRRKQRVRWSAVTAMFLWSALSLLPDADVIGFRFGVRYADVWGHRGATHSLTFALLLGVGIGTIAAVFSAPPLRTGVCAIAVLASHGLLDTLTDGGLGCALLWPFDHHRYFAPWRPIPVAPIGRAYLSSYGLRVATVELLMFLPLIAYALWPSSRTATAGEGVED